MKNCSLGILLFVCLHVLCYPLHAQVFDTSGGNNNNNAGSNTGSVSGGGSGGGVGTGSGSGGGSSTTSNDNELINDFTENYKWMLGATSRTFDEGHLDIAIGLANSGNQELGIPAMQRPGAQPVLQARNLAEQAIQQISALAQQPMVQTQQGAVSGRDLLLNANPNSAEYLRVTFNPLQTEDLIDDYEGTCHVPFKSRFSSDKGKQTVFLGSRIATLTKTLLDWPRVKAESSRSNLAGGNIFRCFKHNKAKGMTSGKMLDIVKSKGVTMKSGTIKFNTGEADFIKSMELIPELKAASQDKDYCIDFAGDRAYWSGANNERLHASYRGIAAMHKLDAYEFFQRTSGDLKLPVSHTISDHDRYVGVAGNLALEAAQSYGIPWTCPSMEEIVGKMNGKGALGFNKANRLDQNNLNTAESQVYERWQIFSCAGGSFFRGSTLLFDTSDALCQTDSSAKPVEGNIYKFWQFEIPYMPGMTVIPAFQTRVC